MVNLLGFNQGIEKRAFPKLITAGLSLGRDLFSAKDYWFFRAWISLQSSTIS